MWILGIEHLQQPGSIQKRHHHISTSPSVGPVLPSAPRPWMKHRVLFGKTMGVTLEYHHILLFISMYAVYERFLTSIFVSIFKYIYIYICSPSNSSQIWLFDLVRLKKIVILSLLLLLLLFKEHTHINKYRECNIERAVITCKGIRYMA